jgi:hypothetical protein
MSAVESTRLLGELLLLFPPADISSSSFRSNRATSGEKPAPGRPRVAMGEVIITLGDKCRGVDAALAARRGTEVVGGEEWVN